MPNRVRDQLHIDSPDMYSQEEHFPWGKIIDNFLSKFGPKGQKWAKVGKNGRILKANTPGTEVDTMYN